jgi:pimeloyl-ACP methyl ester carboxylesterase
VLLVVAGLLALLVAPISFAALVGQRPPDWLPTPLAHFAFDVRLATAPLAKKLISTTHGSPLDKRVYVAGAGQRVSFESGGVQLTASLYRRGATDVGRPAVLLLHGSTPEGRRMGLYRIMADALADRGYVVLAIDQRGFGQSAPAPDPSRADAYDYIGDAVRSLSWLARLPGIDSSRVSVAGHSFGSGVALDAGLASAHADAIVVMGTNPEALLQPTASAGPPRGERDRSYFARRAYRYGSMVGAPGVEYIGQPQRLSPVLEGRLAEADHNPILLVADDAEPADALAAFATWEDALPGPSRLVVAERADHYLNTAGFGAVVVYDARVLDQVIGEVDRWLGGSATGCAGAGTCTWPGTPFLLLVIIVLVLLAAVAAILYVRMRSAPQPRADLHAQLVANE